MTDKEKLAEQYNAFCEELGLTKPIEILNACEVLDKVYKQGKHEAMAWHYPSKGELPPMDTRVYLWTKGDVFPVVARRHDFHRSNEEWSWDCYWGSGFEIKANADCIIAWQYIIPPQEEV